MNVVCTARIQVSTSAAALQGDRAGQNAVDMCSKLTHAAALPAGEDHACIVDDDSGAVLLDVRPMQRVWVRLGAQASRSHGPTLRIRLLAPGHPDAIKAATAAAQSRPQHQSNPVCELAVVFMFPIGFWILV